MRRLIFIAAILLSLSAFAQEPPPLEDPVLDHFVGEWRVERTRPNGKVAQTSIRGEWVLKHHFVQLHYGYADADPPYEAFVYLGFDDHTKSYVCHWVDTFGGNYSLLGHGKLDPSLTSIEFHFDGDDGNITNKMTFDPQTKTWTSLIRQQEKAGAEWKEFLHEKWTKK